MNPKIFLGLMALLIVSGLVLVDQRQARAGEMAGAGEVIPPSGYKVLDPIRHGNLTVFPVVTAKSYPTGEFLTLDEGLRSGEVVVTESGNVQGLIRRHPTPHYQVPQAQVDKLVLINNSKRPLLLLAGEVVTGGHQDRVIAKDRIVPPESEPVDLGVFCVEPGRWTGVSANFNASGATYASAPHDSATGIAGGVGGAVPSRIPSTLIVQPSVRAKVMADKDQQKVWDEVRKQQAAETVEVQTAGAPPPVATELGQTTSYAKVMENEAVKKQVNEIAAPIEHNYQSLIGQLKDRHAVGVVVAVNGRIIWADIFASTDLLEKYWPKLVRSYASEAVVTRAKDVEVSTSRAQEFLADMEGRRETIESEPGIYRHTEVNGDGFKAFALTSLLPKTGFDVHVAKMAE